MTYTTSFPCRNRQSRLSPARGIRRLCIHAPAGAHAPYQLNAIIYNIKIEEKLIVPPIGGGGWQFLYPLTNTTLLVGMRSILNPSTTCVAYSI